jgi:hypothetical protein
MTPESTAFERVFVHERKTFIGPLDFRAIGRMMRAPDAGL